MSLIHCISDVAAHRCRNKVSSSAWIALLLVLIVVTPARADHLPPIDPLVAGADHSHKDHRGHYHARVSIPGIDLSNADLTFAVLFLSALVNANLSGANLVFANLTNAILAGANLDQAKLPARLPSLPVIPGAVVPIDNALDVSGQTTVAGNGVLSISTPSFTAAGLDLQGGAELWISLGGLIDGDSPGWMWPARLRWPAHRKSPCWATSRRRPVPPSRSLKWPAV